MYSDEQVTDDVLQEVAITLRQVYHADLVISERGSQDDEPGRRLPRGSLRFPYELHDGVDVWVALHIMHA
jgi:hypothetical protein